MSSARRLYRLHLGLAGLGGTAVVLAAAVAVTRMDPAVPSVAGFLAACRRIVPLEPGPGLLLVLGFVALGLVVSALATRSLIRQLRTQRRLLGALEAVDTVEVAGRPVTLIESDRPEAFCAGALRPRIYLSRAARTLLSDGELRAVVAHEAHHQANRDPLRILLARVLADALFFLPALRRLSRRYGELTEVAADQAATKLVGGQALASALLAFGERQGAAGAVVGIAPERVDHLLGRRPGWQLPLSVFAGSLLTLAALVALILTVPTLIERESVNVAMLLAEACMAAMATAPLAIFAFAVALSRRRLRRV